MFINLSSTKSALEAAFEMRPRLGLLCGMLAVPHMDLQHGSRDALPGVLEHRC